MEDKEGKKGLSAQKIQHLCRTKEGAGDTSSSCEAVVFFFKKPFISVLPPFKQTLSGDMVEHGRLLDPDPSDGG